MMDSLAEKGCFMKREWVGFGISSFCLGLICLLAACSSKAVQTADTIAPSPETAGATDSNDNGVSSGGVSDIETVYFPYDASTLTKEARTSLKKSVTWLNAHPSASIQIEGHCDERGSVEYNLALGEQRASVVKAYLTKMGIDGSRLSTISYGKERPVDSGHDEAAWAKNRRAASNLVSTHLSKSE
jgi:peptidoglycan-associated lipoprotein